MFPDTQTHTHTHVEFEASLLNDSTRLVRDVYAREREVVSFKRVALEDCIWRCEPAYLVRVQQLSFVSKSKLTKLI